MEYKIVGSLTEEECNEIQDLFEKKNAYENLIKIIDVDEKNIYEKLIKEYSRTLSDFNKWWKDYSRIYKWEGQNWVIDFENKRVLSN